MHKLILRYIEIMFFQNNEYNFICQSLYLVAYMYLKCLISFRVYTWKVVEVGALCWEEQALGAAVPPSPHHLTPLLSNIGKTEGARDTTHTSIVFNKF